MLNIRQSSRSSRYWAFVCISGWCSTNKTTIEQTPGTRHEYSTKTFNIQNNKVYFPFCYSQLIYQKQIKVLRLNKFSAVQLPVLERNFRLTSTCILKTAPKAKDFDFSPCILFRFWLQATALVLQGFSIVIFKLTKISQQWILSSSFCKNHLNVLECSVRQNLSENTGQIGLL